MVGCRSGSGRGDYPRIPMETSLLTVVAVVVTKMDAASDWDDEVTSLNEEAKKKKDAQMSDLPGGGKFWSWNDEDGNWVTVLTHKDLTRIFCRTHAKPTADAAMVEACKSIRPM